jgi:hypothetical protein
MRGSAKGRFSGMDDPGSEEDTCYPGSRNDRIRSSAHRAGSRRPKKNEWA